MTPVQTQNIPFFDYPSLFTSEEEELVAIFRDVGRRGAFILQQDLEHFERNLRGLSQRETRVKVSRTRLTD